MFWFNGWTVYLMKGVSNMAIKKYIGARYAPKFMGAWDKASEYAALSVVYTNEQSYVSRKTVPANTEITNTEFWIKSADWNAQVTQYNENVEQYNQNVERYNQNVETYLAAVDQFYADTLHSYDTKAEMVADTSLKLGDTLLTCGGTAIGDGGGSFYQVVSETSAKAVALENGLFALPFEFQPYDYSEFQGEVDRVVESFGTSVAEIKAASLGTYDNVAKMKADTTLKANTTVLTTGEATVGDNKGSFYRVQDTSNRPDAVPLNNGKKAVPFALDVGAVAGTALTFVGKSDAAAVWNVKAPGTVTIPLSVSAGGVATVFLGVLYGTTESTVTATLNINNGNLRTLTFTDKGDATHDKIVVYAITVKYDGSTYNWGSAVSASWNVAYSHDTIKATATFPAILQPANTAVVASGLSYSQGQSLGLCAVTVSKRLRVDSIGLKFGQEAAGGLEGLSRVIRIASSDDSGYNLREWCDESAEGAQPSGSVTYNILPDKAVLEPGKTYYLQVGDFSAERDIWYITESATPGSEQGAITMLPAGTVWDAPSSGIENFVTTNRVSIQFNYTVL